MKRKLREYFAEHLTPLTITAIYALVGWTWVLFSDVLLAVLLKTPPLLTYLQILKEGVFIFATALILYALIKRGMFTIERPARLHQASERRFHLLEEKLRETLEEHEIILENALVGIAFTRDRIVERGNEKCEEIFGYCRGEVIGRSTEPFYPSREEFERHGQEIQRSLSAGGHYSGEVLMQKKDRSLFWCRLFGKALASSDLSRGIIWIIEDVTARRQAEEALRASQEYARNIIDSSLDMIIAVDNDRTITEFNRAACETFGYERGEIIGEHVDVLYADPGTGQEVHHTVLRNGRCIREILNRRKSGEVFPSFLSASVVLNAEDEVVGVMGLSRDITERKRVEEELLRARKLDSLGVLAGGIAHDFNNILTAIMGNISLALLSGSGGHEMEKRLADAENACLRAKELTGKLL
ncbi:MAG: PAS domain S-box protein, partial [Nitrospirales bacterium]|nr:PAS domain S-box protein [Nitrospirales bacterium]